MPLPEFREDGWLPTGHHRADWEEVVVAFGGEEGSLREQVLIRLLAWRDQVRAKGMAGLLILNGSFISRKAKPKDFDCLFLYDEATAEIIKYDTTALALVSYGYCKATWQGDIFAIAAATVRRFPQMCRLDLFDFEKITGKPKGVVEVRI